MADDKRIINIAPDWFEQPEHSDGNFFTVDLQDHWKQGRKTTPVVRLKVDKYSAQMIIERLTKGMKMVEEKLQREINTSKELRCIAANKLSSNND